MTAPSPALHAPAPSPAPSPAPAPFAPSPAPAPSAPSPALHSSAPPDAPFDALLALAAQLCSVPVAAFTLLDHERPWFDASVGLRLPPPSHAPSLCDDPLVVPDTAQDPRFADHPHVVGAPHIRFQAALAVRAPDGRRIGTLTVVDSVPRQLSPEQLRALEHLRGHIETLIALRVQITSLAASRSALEQEAARRADVVRCALDAIMVLDAHGRIEEFNPAAEKIFRMRRDDVLGRELAETVVIPAHREQHRQRLAWFTANDPIAQGGFRVESRSLRGDGTTFPVEITIVPAMAGDRVIYLNFVRDLTERDAERRRVTEHERLFASAFDHAPSGVALVDGDGRCLRANGSLCAMLDRVEADLLGVGPHEMIAREDADALQHGLRALADGTGHDVFEIEARALPRNGRALRALVRVAAASMPDAATRVFVVHVTDITPRYLAEARLRASQQRLRLLLAASRDLVFEFDPDGRYIDAWSGDESALAHPREEMLGRTLDEVLGVESARPIRELIDIAVATGRHEAREYPLHKFGRMHWFLGEALRVPGSDNESVVVIFAARDITERKRTEIALASARDAAEAASRAKSVFLGNVSHELRTPLHAILGFSRLLERQTLGLLDQDHRSHLRDIIESGEHMLGLVTDLLDLRALDAGRESDVERMPCSLSDAAREAVRLVRPLLDEHRHALVVDVDPSLPDVLAESRRVVQIFVNLLSNAARYTAPGGHIRIGSCVTPQSIQVSIVDDGDGIALEDQARLFRYFEQVGGPRGAHTTGSGLGLALTRAMLERFGGSISVRSQPGRGSTFTFELQRADLAMIRTRSTRPSRAIKRESRAVP